MIKELWETTSAVIDPNEIAAIVRPTDGDNAVKVLLKGGATVSVTAIGKEEKKHVYEQLVGRWADETQRPCMPVPKKA